MARWSAAINSGGSNVRTTGSILAATTNMRRAKLIDILFGSSQAPADNEFTYTIQRCTLGSQAGSLQTPNATDQADTLASTMVVTGVITVDPSYTAGANALNWAMNQRASARWIPVPFDELLTPATASTGYGIGVSAATTTNFGGTVNYEEL